MRARPPRAPLRPRPAGRPHDDRDAAPTAQVLEAARKVLRGKRFRVHSHDAASVSSESGHLKETGNLVFHTGPLVVIIGVAVGHSSGGSGDVILTEGAVLRRQLSALRLVPARGHDSTGEALRRSPST